MYRGVREFEAGTRTGPRPYSPKTRFGDSRDPGHRSRCHPGGVSAADALNSHERRARANTRTAPPSAALALASALKGLGHLSSAGPRTGRPRRCRQSNHSAALELRPTAAPDQISRANYLGGCALARHRRSGDLRSRSLGGARSPEHPLVPRRRSPVDRRAARSPALPSVAGAQRLRSARASLALAGSRIPIVADAARAPRA